MEVGSREHVAEVHGIVAVLVGVVVVGAVTVVVVVVAAAVFSILMSVMTPAAIGALCTDAGWLPPKITKRLAKIPIFWGKDSNFIVSPMWPGGDAG